VKELMVRPAVFGFLLLPLALPGAAADADTPFQRIAREIRRLVAEQTVPSVVVAVAKDGRIIWEFAVGWADRERRIAATFTRKSTPAQDMASDGGSTMTDADFAR
jgi:CubicO group peptidase (beta-lactamase class C family)